MPKTYFVWRTDIWKSMARKDKFKLVSILTFFIIGYILFGLITELPVWYFRLKTFSTDDNRSLQNRESICATLQPPHGRIGLNDLSEFFPESFYKDKHFFEVYYSPHLKQCIYTGVDVSVPKNASSSISFYIASPYFKNCVISQGKGWCVGSRSAHVKGGGGSERSIMYGKNLILPEIASPLPVAAPAIQEPTTLSWGKTTGSIVSTTSLKYGISSTPFAISHDSDTLLFKHRFGAIGAYSQYTKVYGAYYEMVHPYLIK